MPTLLLVDGAHYKYLMAKSPPQFMYMPLSRRGNTAHVGRRPVADMDLHQDDHVSARHIAVRWVAATAQAAGHFEVREVEDPEKPAGQRWPTNGTFVMTPQGWQRLQPGGVTLAHNRDEIRVGHTSVIVFLDEDFPPPLEAVKENLPPINPAAPNADALARQYIDEWRRRAGMRDARSISRPPDAGRDRTQP